MERAEAKFMLKTHPLLVTFLRHFASDVGIPYQEHDRMYHCVFSMSLVQLAEMERYMQIV